MSTQRILFLDIDGVLNNNASRKLMYICEFHSRIGSLGYHFNKEEFNFVDECMDNLKLISERIPDLKVVIASNWRHGGAKPEHFKSLFSLWGIDLNVIDMIDPHVVDDTTYKRSFMIMKWLRDYKHKLTSNKTPDTMEDIINYLAVDDREDLYHSEFSRVVYTDPDVGLSLYDAASIITMLNRN